MAGGDAALPRRPDGGGRSATTRSRVSSSRSEERQRVARREQELHAEVHGEPEGHAPPEPEDRTRSAPPGGRGDVGTVIVGQNHHRGRRGGRCAEPSAPIVRTRLRKSPPKRKAAKKQIRSQAISSSDLQGEQGQTQTDGDADHAENRAEERGGRVLLRDQVHEDPWPAERDGIRCVRIGTVATRQARVRRNVALPRPGVGASSRRRKARSAATRSPLRALERAVNRRDGGGAHPERVVRDPPP